MEPTFEALLAAWRNADLAAVAPFFAGDLRGEVSLEWSFDVLRGAWRLGFLRLPERRGRTRGHLGPTGRR